METSEHTREARARRILRNLDYRLVKAPSRHWTRDQYGVGYMVVGAFNNTVRSGACQREYELSLDDVEQFVTAELAREAEDEAKLLA
jgi:hypothetical protein